MSSEEMLQETASKLKEFLVARNVLGEAIDLGDKVVIPVARFGFGFGAGEGTGKSGAGKGAGGGGGLEPVALIILHKDVKGPEGVQVMSISKENPVAQVISALGESLAPQVIQAIKSMDRKKQPPAENADTGET
ncbi:MAG TPA: spore germination protein GerW family protein [Methanoregula sp.]|nr:spore germination protein GerW family protein [Methanoregula sp.]